MREIFWAQADYFVTPTIPGVTQRIKVDIALSQGRLSADSDREFDRLDVVDYFVGLGIKYDGEGWFIDCPRAREIIPANEIIDSKSGPM